MQTAPMTVKEVANYRSITSQVAHCIMRDVRGDVDTMSMERGDYAHELFVKALVALNRWRSDDRLACQGSTAEHRYVCKCIWNSARTFERDRLAAHYRRQKTAIQASRVFVDSAFEERAIARQTLCMLRTRIKPRDWRVLCQIAISEGDRAQGGSRKVQRKRQRAKKEVKRVSPFLE